MLCGTGSGTPLGLQPSSLDPLGAPTWVPPLPLGPSQRCYVGLDRWNNIEGEWAYHKATRNVTSPVVLEAPGNIEQKKVDSVYPLLGS